MSIEKTPAGTRGARTPPRLLMKVLMPILGRVHRLTGNKVGDMPLVYLTTIGAKSGNRRTTPVVRFDDGQGGWFVIASYGGAVNHPAWYYNIAAHPDQVWAEVDGVTHQVVPAQLDGAERDKVWADVVRRAAQFGKYETNTDRTIPVLRLTPTTSESVDGD